MTGRDIVCLSTQDWDGLWTRKQRFMQMFAEAGNRVLYIETPVHLLGLDVLPKDPLRFFRFMSGPRPIGDRLFVATLPILLPMFQMSHRVNRANHIVIRALLRRWIDKLRFRNVLFWIYTPSSAPLITGTEFDAVYECVDEFRAARGLISPRAIGQMEDDLLRRVRFAIVTQENLLPHRASICPNTFCVPNAADTALFTDAAWGGLKIPEDIARIPDRSQVDPVSGGATSGLVLRFSRTHGTAGASRPYQAFQQRSSVRTKAGRIGTGVLAGLRLLS